VIQLCGLVAVHAHAEPVLTEMAPLNGVDGTAWLRGDTEYAQLPAAWVIVTAWPATVIVPVRALVVEFAATLYATDPRPEWLPLATVIQLCGLVAVHAQLEPVITETAPLNGVDGTDWLSGDTEYVQLPTACVIVTVWPATLIVPVRALEVEFAATL
jgi:hypothetical protein